MLGIAALGIAGVVVATILLTADIQGVADVVMVLLLGVSLAVAAAPEGLPAILSVVLAMGVGRMARHHAIVKTLASVDTRGSASVIASDKTATFTRGEMTLQRVTRVSGRSDITGVGHAPEGSAETAGVERGADPRRAELQDALCGGSLAGNAQLQQGADGAWRIQGDPTEAAFPVPERKLRPAGADASAPAWHPGSTRIGKIPFTSQRKMMPLLVQDMADGGRLLLLTKGAPDVLLPHCTQARRGAATVALDAALRAQVLASVLAQVLALPPDYVEGLILMGCMPGGTTSNIFACFSKGTLSLSTLMTISSPIVAIVLVPITLASYPSGIEGPWQFPLENVSRRAWRRGQQVEAAGDGLGLQGDAGHGTRHRGQRDQPGKQAALALADGREVGDAGDAVGMRDADHLAQHRPGQHRPWVDGQEPHPARRRPAHRAEVVPGGAADRHRQGIDPDVYRSTTGRWRRSGRPAMPRRTGPAGWQAAR